MWRRLSACRDATNMMGRPVTQRLDRLKYFNYFAGSCVHTAKVQSQKKAGLASGSSGAGNGECRVVEAVEGQAHEGRTARCSLPPQQPLPLHPRPSSSVPSRAKRQPAMRAVQICVRAAAGGVWSWRGPGAGGRAAGEAPRRHHRLPARACVSAVHAARRGARCFARRRQHGRGS
jgi:hypothetical protein